MKNHLSGGKFLLSAMTVFLLGGLLFAGAKDMEPDIGNGYMMATSPMRVTTGRFEGMGQAGVALHSDKDALWTNPASLSTSTWSWHVPAVSVTAYNVRDILKSDFGKDAASGNMKDMKSYLPDLISIYGKAGYSEIARFDMSGGFKTPNFAISGDVQINTYTHVPVEDKMQVSVIPQADMSLSVGYGYRFLKNSPVSIDAGVAARLVYRGYFSKINLDTFMNASGSNDMVKVIADSTPVVTGISLPIDVGINVNLPWGFSTGMVYRNLNGKFFSLSWYENAEAIKNNEGTNDPFSISVAPSLDAGIAWQPKMGAWGWITEPMVAVDLTGIDGLVRKGFSAENFFGALHAGMEIKLFKLLEFRAGLSGGYMTAGAGLDLFHLIHLEITYGHQTFPLGNGTKNVDKLMIRGNILWER